MRRGVAARQRGRQLAFGHHIQPVTDFKQFFELFTDHQHGATRIPQSKQLAPYLRRCPHINPPSGLRNNQQYGFGINFAAHDELLQIAARQRPGQRRVAARLDFVARNDAFSLRLQQAAVKPA